MPVATDESGEAALEAVKASLSALEDDDNEDTEFLTDFLNNPVLSSLIQTLDVLEEEPAPNPLTAQLRGCLKLVQNEIDSIAGKDDRAKELKNLLAKPHLKSAAEAHDDIASKNYDPYDDLYIDEPEDETNEPLPSQPPVKDAVRMVGIRKSPDEPLGITVVKQQGDLVVARILADSFVERQGLLHTGDIIKEVNGQEVQTPEQLMDIVKRASGNITLKVKPSYNEQNHTPQVFIRCHYTYDPMKDNLIPCKEAGLPFVEGEILQVLNMEDNSWWQAKKVTEDCRAGLIPSQQLEERRKAFVKPEYDYTKKSLFCGLTSKKKKKTMYKSSKNSDFDNNDLMIYEEVTRLPPFQRKTLVLIGAPGVGRRSLKDLLLEHSPKTFGTALPHTSRAPRPDEEPGVTYNFSSRDQMDDDIRNDLFLEHGDFGGNLYGVKLDSIKRVIHRGKICIVDCNPQAIKMLKSGEFMPYIVFVAAPSIEILRNMWELGRSEGLTQKTYTERDFIKTVEESARIERAYRHFFDLIIVNDNMEETYRTLIENMESLVTEPQWVPVNWVY